MANDEGKGKKKEKKKGKKEEREVIDRPVVEIISDGKSSGKKKRKQKLPAADRKMHREHSRMEGW